MISHFSGSGPMHLPISKHPSRGSRSAGMTLIEICVVLVLMAVLTASASMLVGKYGRRNVIENEARQAIGFLTDLRSKATTGMGNPCLDFPDAYTVRLYRDTSRVPNGFGAGDPVFLTHAWSGGVKALDIDGGTGSLHYVCFESKGVLGAPGRALELDLGTDPANARTVRLLPSTGVARML